MKLENFYQFSRRFFYVKILLLCLFSSGCGTIPTSFWYIEPSNSENDFITLAQIDNDVDLILHIRQTYGVEDNDFLVNVALTKPTEKTVKVCFDELVLETNKQKYKAKAWWANKYGSLTIPDDFHSTAINEECLIYADNRYNILHDKKTYIGFKGENGGIFEYFILEGVAHYWHEDARLTARFRLEVDNKTVYNGEMVKNIKKKSYRPMIPMR